METPHIFGIDVSKHTLDVVYHPNHEHVQVLNHAKGFRLLLRMIKNKALQPGQCWFVFEHTGMYSLPLVRFCIRSGIPFTQQSGLAIKRSLGLVRGKNDRIDALRISNYAYEKKETLRLTPAPDENIQRIKTLLKLRNRMVAQRSGYKAAVKQMPEFMDLSSRDVIIRSQQALIKALTEQIQKIEQQLTDLLKADEKLWFNFKLLQTIPGVGEIVALHTLVYTENFIRFTDARKFACYCGVAPFESSSGKTIRGKTRVSHLANKTMKFLLELAARSAIGSDPELKQYYHQRVEKGKQKTSTRNVIRNKIVFRMFAIIKRQTPFIKQTVQAA